MPTPANDTDTEIPEVAESNVIQFPIISKRLPSAYQNISMEEVEAAAYDRKMKEASVVVDAIVVEMFINLKMHGFDFEDDRYTKDTIMVLEAVKSLVLKTMGIEYDMQEVTECVIEMPEEM